MELDKVLSKVRGLLAKWESLGDDNPEGKACKMKADEMMTAYAIEQAQLRESAPVAEKPTPGKIRVDDLCECGSPYEIPITGLVALVAEHCRCQAVFHNIGKTEAEARAWEEAWRFKRMVAASVFGFESDLKYFEMLFTVLLHHMASGYDPKPDRSLTDEENAYALHNAGLNWRAIARLHYPWHRMGWDGIINPADGGHLGRAGAYWKSCYKRACLDKAEAQVKLPKFSDSGRGLINYRFNFAVSYTSTVRQRLEEARQGRSKSGELVLASSMQMVTELIEEMFPDLKTVPQEAPVSGYNGAAWSAGRKHGQEADLNVSARVTNKAPKSLG